MSVSGSCTTSSIVSTNIVIAYGCIYAAFLIIVSIYSFKSLHKDPNFSNKSYFQQFKAWITNLRARKSCYIPIIAHLFDQLTDISVIIQFGQLATTKYHNNWEDCNGLNIYYLFILSILTLLLYRIISGYLVYKYTNNSWKRFFSQIFDIELFRSLHINYLCDKNEPCDPQRWLTAMEAALESTPQSLIQLIYLVRTGAFHADNLIFMISFASSLWSIISKLVGDDKVIIVEEGKKLGIQYKIRTLKDIFVSFIYFIIEVIVFIIGFPYFMFQGSRKMYYYSNYWKNTKWDQFEDRMWPYIGHFKTVESVSWIYILRVIWRMLDVSSRLFVMVLTWIVIGGFHLGIIIGLELISFLIICTKTKHWELIFGIVSLVVSMSEETKRVSAVIFIYRTITNILLTILMTVWLFTNFECYKCTPYSDRSMFASSDSDIFGMFIYCWIAVFVSPMILLTLITINAFNDGATTSRDLKQMIESNNVEGILELQLYAEQYGIYDKKNNKSLLTLSFEENKYAIISYLINKQSDKIDDLLDFYLEHQNLFSSKIIVSTYKKHKHFSSKNGLNAYWCAITTSDTETIQKLIRYDADLINSTDNSQLNILDHYVTNPALLSTEDLQYIEQKYPEFTDKLFTASVVANNREYIAKLSKNIDISTFTDSQGRGIYHYVALGDYECYDQFFELKDDETDSVFEYESDSDKNGLLYYLGTRYGTQKYDNPARIGMVNVKVSPRLKSGDLNDFVGTDGSAIHCLSTYGCSAQIVVDIKRKFKLTHYTMKYEVQLGRLWILSGSNDGIKWKTVHKRREAYKVKDRSHRSGQIRTYTFSVETHSYFDHYRLSIGASYTDIDVTEMTVYGIEFYGEILSSNFKQNACIFYEEYPYCIQHNGRSAFFEVCNAGDSEIVHKLIRKYPELLNTRCDNKNISNYYGEDASLLNAEDLLYIQQLQPQLVKTLFFHAFSNENNKEYFERMNNFMNEGITTYTDIKGQGIYHYVAMGNYQYYSTFFVINDDKIDEKLHIEDRRIFIYESDFDKNGYLYYLGTGYGKESFVFYKNPSKIGMIEVTAGPSYNFSAINITDRDKNTIYCTQIRKDAAKNPYIQFTLKQRIKLSHYSLRVCISNTTDSRLQNWSLEGSNDGYQWIMLSKHINDTSFYEEINRDFNATFDDIDKVQNVLTNTWEINTNLYFNQFRISFGYGGSHFLTNLKCSGIEFYGEMFEISNICNFYKRFTNCLKHDGKSLFFEVCNDGNTKEINNLITRYPQLIDRVDEENRNILDYYKQQQTLLNDDILKYIYKQRPNLKSIDEKEEKQQEIDYFDDDEEKYVDDENENEKKVDLVLDIKDLSVLDKLKKKLKDTKNNYKETNYYENGEKIDLKIDKKSVMDKLKQKLKEIPNLNDKQKNEEAKDRKNTDQDLINELTQKLKERAQNEELKNKLNELGSGNINKK